MVWTPGQALDPKTEAEPRGKALRENLKSLTQEEYEALPDSEKDFTHTHWGTIFLYGEPERYVNHSSNPNTHPNLVNAVKCDVAIRNIKKGEMVTTNAILDDIK